MPAAKKIGLAILSPLFIFLLFATAFDIGFVRTATNPTAVKELVNENGLYSTVVPNVLAQTKSISTAYGDIPVTDTAVKQAAEASLSPQYIKQNTETIIDNIYAWLDGKTAQPNFNIDLSVAKNNFANNIAASLQTRLAGLPRCSLAQSREIAAAGNFDAYNAPCLPSGVNPATVAEQLKTSVAGQDDFLKNLQISSGSFKNATTGQSLFEQPGVKNIPVQYQRAKKSPFILVILTILTGVGIVFLSRTWQSGLRHIGINLLIIGMVMLVFAWVLNWGVNNKLVPKIKVDSAIFQQDIKHLVTDVTHQINKNYWFFGGLYMFMGGACFTGYFALTRNQQTPGPVKKPGK